MSTSFCAFHRIASFGLCIGLTATFAGADEQHRGTFSLIVKSEAARHPVLPGNSNVWGTGAILARPGRTTPRTGMYWKSDEIHLVIGQFGDDPKYGGNTYDVSTTDPAMLKKIDALDPTKQYQFIYNVPYPFRFNMTDTSTEIIDIKPAKTPEEFLSSGLPTEVEVVNGRHGFKRAPTIRNGRIVSVERWNTYFTGRAICSFDFDLGGSRHSEKDDFPNIIRFNVYSEEACKYVTDALPYGLEMRVWFSTSYFTVDRYVHTAHAITVDHVPGLVANTPAMAASIPTFAQEVLSDPDFQSGTRKLIDDYSQKKANPVTTPVP